MLSGDTVEQYALALISEPLDGQGGVLDGPSEVRVLCGVFRVNQPHVHVLARSHPGAVHVNRAQPRQRDDRRHSKFSAASQVGFSAEQHVGVRGVRDGEPTSAAGEPRLLTRPLRRDAARGGGQS